MRNEECVDYLELKGLHKKLRSESIVFFREKAVGQNLKDFEAKIHAEIQSRYHLVKSKCLQIYEAKCMS